MYAKLRALFGRKLVDPSLNSERNRLYISPPVATLSSQFLRWGASGCTGRQPWIMKPGTCMQSRATKIWVSTCMATAIYFSVGEEKRGGDWPFDKKYKTGSGEVVTTKVCGSLENLVRELLKGSGLIHGSSHSGRRTLATWLDRKGYDLELIQLILGHRNPDMTLETSKPLLSTAKWWCFIILILICRGSKQHFSLFGRG